MYNYFLIYINWVGFANCVAKKNGGLNHKKLKGRLPWDDMPLDDIKVSYFEFAIITKFKLQKMWLTFSSSTSERMVHFLSDCACLTSFPSRGMQWVLTKSFILACRSWTCGGSPARVMGKSPVNLSYWSYQLNKIYTILAQRKTIFQLQT